MKYKESVYCSFCTDPDKPTKCGGPNAWGKIIEHLKVKHPGILNKTYH